METIASIRIGVKDAEKHLSIEFDWIVIDGIEGYEDDDYHIHIYTNSDGTYSYSLCDNHSGTVWGSETGIPYQEQDEFSRKLHDLYENSSTLFWQAITETV